MEHQKKKYKSGKSRRETAVQGTNDSSIVSKCSMASVGYFDDDFLHEFVSKTAKRSPLINRGYYIRATAVDFILKKFLSSHTTKKQILSLGAGFDSAYFRLKAKGFLEDIVFYEIDFSDVVRRKHAVILTKQKLQDLIPGYSGQNKNADPLVEIDTPGYKLLGVDLTQHNVLEALLKALGVDFDAPTLLLSECVLTYMTKRCSSKVIQWAAETFTNSTFVLYEQINPDDAFGLFMQNHFKTIGSALKCINAYPSMASQLDRFKSMGWEECEALDMNQFYNNLVCSEERARVEHLEPFDEYEEWHLKCYHYMILCAYNGFCQPLLKGIDQSVASATNKQTSSLISIKPIPNVMPLMRIGHASMIIGDVIITIGGFGEEGGKHQRLSSVTVTDIKSFNSKVLHLEVDLKTTEIGRLRHTLCPLKDGSIIMVGGRMSPIYPCNQLLRLKITRGDNSQNFDIQGDNSDSTVAQNSTNCSNCGKVNSQDGLQVTLNSTSCLSNNVILNSHGPKNEVTNSRQSVTEIENINLENVTLSDSRTSNCQLNVEKDKNETKIDGENSVSGVNDSNRMLDRNSEEQDYRINEEDSNCGNSGAANHLGPFIQSIDCDLIQQTGEIPVPRWRHTSTVCNKSGTEVIFVYGGRNEKQLALDCSYFLEPATGKWTKVYSSGSNPGYRQSHSVSAWNNYIILAGGLDSDLRPLNSVYMLDIDTLVWKELLLKGDFQPRYAHTAQIIDNQLVLIGGVNMNHQTLGVAVICLLSGACAEYQLPSADMKFLVMLQQHQMCYLGNGQFVILGGGGNCFSFGTHLNRSPFIIDVNKCLQHFNAIQS